MRAIVPGLVGGMILVVALPSGAAAAKKKGTQDSSRPPQDSVLWVPRVSKPPDLEAFLTGIKWPDQEKKKGRAAKAAPDARSTPEVPAPDSSPSTSSSADAAAASASGAGKAQAVGSSAPAPVATTSSATDALATASVAAASAATASSTTAPQADAPSEAAAPAGPQRPDAPPTDSGSAPSPAAADSLARTEIESAARDSSGAPPGALAPAPPTEISNPAGPPEEPRPSDSPPSTTGDGVPPSPAPEPSATGGAPSASLGGPPPSSSRVAGPVAQEDLVLWLFAAFAGLFMVWTGFAWRGVRGSRARQVPKGPSRSGGGRGGRNAEANGAPGVPAVIELPRGAETPSAVPAGSAPADSPGRHSRIRKMLVANLWRVKGSLLLAALFMVGGAAVELLKPWPLKVIVDHVVLAKPLSDALSFLQRFPENGINLLVVCALAIVLISLLGGVFSYFEVFITKAIGIRMVYTLRREVFSHLQRLSLSFHNRARSGDLLTTFAKDTHTLKDVFAEALLKFADHFLSVAGMLVILWFVNWKMALIALASLPFLAFTLLRLYRQTKLSLKKQRKQEGKVASRMTEVLAAVPLVQAFGRERHEEERYEAVSNATLRESIRMTRLEAAASRSSHIMTAVGTAGTVLFGGMEVLRGNMLPGELVLVMSYLSSMYKPLRQLAKLSIDFSKASASAERIAEVLEVEPEIQDRPDAIEADEVKGEIAFAAVSFDYGDGREVLRRVSFEVGPGQRLALVGVSGAGKSTIASLMLRLYQAQSGAILIDGVGIERYRRESLRRQIGIVLQQSVLFGATIRENIAYGKPEASAEEIVAAAQAANADEFIREQEEGYDAVIGERGVTLSAGQRQRIAIARAIIRNPRILILDEPMTGLDAESEHKVRQALDRLMGGKTTIMITHDLQTIADADQVLLLEDGQIAERGTHFELIHRSGRYRQLFDLGRRSVLPQPVEP